MGLIASLGYESIPVYRKPRLAAIVTGDEITKPGRRLMPGRIYDSNSYALKAVAKELGIEERFAYHAGENFKQTCEAFERALKVADVIVSTGGVSVGDFDYVKPALEHLGFQTAVWKIAIKPGKPVYFGKKLQGRSTKYVFGLPGNPVSALVTFQLFVKPALGKMMGLSTFADRSLVAARLMKTLKKKAGRMEFVRGMVELNDKHMLVTPAVGQDSHMLSGLAKANCLIQFPADKEVLKEGVDVVVELLNWHW
jgi:molybdopterin molybdotransferase